MENVNKGKRPLTKRRRILATLDAE